MEELPGDVIGEIIKHLDQSKDRIPFLTTCKRFNGLGRIFFDPTVNENKFIGYLCSKLERIKNGDGDGDGDGNEKKDDGGKNEIIDVEDLGVLISEIEELIKDKRIDASVEENRLLNLSCRFTIPSLVHQLIEKKSVWDTYVDWKVIMKYCAREGDIHVLDCLLKEKRFDPTIKSNSLIRTSCRLGHFKMLKIILRDGRSDPSDCNNFCIRLAAECGHLEVVKLLLTDERVDPTSYHNDALRWSSTSGHHQVVFELCRIPQVSVSVTPKQTAGVIDWAFNSQTPPSLVSEFLENLPSSLLTKEFYSFVVQELVTFDDSPCLPFLVLIDEQHEVSIPLQTLAQYTCCNEVLCWACLRKDTGAVVSKLLDHPSVDPTAENGKALLNALSMSSTSCFDVLQILVQDERVVPANETIRWALVSSSKEAIKCLLDSGKLPPSLMKWALENTGEHRVQELKWALDNATDQAVKELIPIFEKKLQLMTHPTGGSGSFSFSASPSAWNFADDSPPSCLTPISRSKCRKRSPGKAPFNKVPSPSSWKPQPTSSFTPPSFPCPDFPVLDLPLNPVHSLFPDFEAKKTKPSAEPTEPAVPLVDNQNDTEDGKQDGPSTISPPTE